MVVLLSCLVLIPSTDETEAASVIEITDVSVKQDADWNGLYSYTDIQILKGNFTVTAIVDGQSRQLTVDEFYLSTGGPLVDGDNTFTVVAYTQDGQDLEESSYEMEDSISLKVDETYSLSSIDAIGPKEGLAYASTTVAEFRQLDGMSVTATFTDPSGVSLKVPIQDYSLK